MAYAFQKRAAVGLNLRCALPMESVYSVLNTDFSESFKFLGHRKAFFLSSEYLPMLLLIHLQYCWNTTSLLLKRKRLRKRTLTDIQD